MEANEQIIAEVRRSLASCAERDPVLTPLILRGELSLEALQGGKMLRPKLLLAVASALGGLNEAHQRKLLVETATAVELAHVASLFHDDVIDEGEMRRGRPSFPKRAGNSLAVLVGDSLFCLALCKIADMQRAEIFGLFTRKLSEACLGEVEQELFLRGRLPPEEGYERVIRKKTGGLFALAAGLAMLVCGGSRSDIHAAEMVGYEIGTGYQILDDVADMTAEALDVGKDVRADLRQAKFTLPILRMAARIAGGVEEATQRFAADPQLAAEVFGECISTAEAHFRAALRAAKKASASMGKAIGAYLRSEIRPAIRIAAGRGVAAAGARR